MAARAGRWLLRFWRRVRALTASNPHPGGRGPDDRGRPPAANARTVIGPQTRLKGRLKGQGEVVVCGTVLGEIDIAGPLTLAATGRIDADVEVQSARLSGQARGTMRASGSVRLDATASFEGEIATPVIDLRPGSVLRGRASILGR